MLNKIKCWFRHDWRYGSQWSSVNIGSSEDIRWCAREGCDCTQKKVMTGAGTKWFDTRRSKNDH